MLLHRTGSGSARRGRMQTSERSIVAETEEAAAEADERLLRQFTFTDRIRGGTVIPHWLQDGSASWYAEGAPHNTLISTVDPPQGTRTELFDRARVRAEVGRLLGHEPAGRAR